MQDSLLQSWHEQNEASVLIIFSIQVTLWDTGSLERAGIGNVTRSYFRYAVGVVLVYDVGNRETLDALCGWMFRVKDAISWQWEDALNVVVWGNNRDHSLNSVSDEQIKGFIDHFGLTEEQCCKMDAYSGFNVFESYQSLIERIHLRLSPLPGLPGLQHKHKHNFEPLVVESESACSC